MIHATALNDPDAKLRAELETVAERLHGKYDRIAGAAVVDAQLSAVMGDMFTEVKIRSFVPVLAEREAGRRLQELAGA